MSWYGYRQYVPVAQRRAKAARQVSQLKDQGVDINPIEIQGRKIAKQFWGEAWCNHLESFSDYSNRLPRGRTYVRNGSVCHLDIKEGKVSAMVSGSDIYNVRISIRSLSKQKWKAVKGGCANQIGSLLDLLQGKIPTRVMEAVTHQQQGLLPLPQEIEFGCDCPDYAHMCKHIAAVMYGIGARLDESPELLFQLRGVVVEELIDTNAEVISSAGDKGNRVAMEGLGDVFGIDLEGAGVEVKPQRRKVTAKKAANKRKPVAKKATAKKKATNMRKRVAKKAIAKKAIAKKATSRKIKPVAKRIARKVVAKKKSAGARLKPITGNELWELRLRLEMPQAKFARLLGLSLGSISYLENRPGLLNLKEDSLRTFKQVKKLSVKKAWEELDKL